MKIMVDTRGGPTGISIVSWGHVCVNEMIKWAGVVSSRIGPGGIVDVYHHLSNTAEELCQLNISHKKGETETREEFWV